MELLTVPFNNASWTDTYEALVNVRGVLRIEPDGLVVEYRRTERDFASSAREGEIQSVHVPWAEVQSITFRRKFFVGGVLVLRTRSLRALEGVPSAKGNELSLTIARADRMTASQLAANVELALAEQHLAALDTSASRSVLPPG